MFANEYMHIDDVVLGANSLGLYQLVEMGETHNRNALGESLQGAFLFFQSSSF